MSLAALSRLLANGEISSRELVEQAIAAIRDPDGEGRRAFLAVHEQQALAAADRSDALRRGGSQPPVLSGIPISIKDLFDEVGTTTLAGSTVLADSPPAGQDCTVVRRLRNAGAIVVGRTNMTEFAYSGLGLNPHYGTPKNAFDRSIGRIPGGSSSGAAISVTDGMAAAAIGTDTGGSVRIPAALNGVVGFKPTARRVPLDGVLPLSFSLDSAGPIAKTVADCALLDKVMSGDTAGIPAPVDLRGLRLAVPTAVFQADLSTAVADAFSRAVARLSLAGATIISLPMREFEQAVEVNPRGALAGAEAWWLHRQWLEKGAGKYDPRVLMRIRRGENVSAAQYIDMLRRRERFICVITAAASDFDAMLMPTTPDIAPTIAEVGQSDDAYLQFNGRMLRNTSIVNSFDGCAISLPCHETGQAPVGLMIAGTQGNDRRILAIGLAAEHVVCRHRCD
jgi:aspartyl-tRNA(Asn)/glutamyl-tRNA(Gln) amidotransferase subunit A